jgi:predicted nucleic acid-binding Zn ribbon protein
MPTYEFRLPDGTIIERSFKISEVPAEIPNPNGEGVAVRIISGGAGLVFKGSGFYLTDYGRNAHRTQGDAPKPSGSAVSPSESKPKTESASGGGSDVKPAATPKSEPKASGSGPAAS